MIVQIRVDDRLIHGQVALLWGKELNTRGILVANDHAAEDATQAATLKMACPAGQKLLIRSVEDAIKVASDPRGKDMRIFGLVDKVSDALKIVEDEVEATKKLVATGVPVIHQVGVTDAKTDVAALVAKLG